MSTSTLNTTPFTFTYKSLTGGQALDLDVWLPANLPSKPASRAAVVWFHAGGGFGGDKSPELNKLFLRWVARLVRRNGWIYINANYRLFSPCSGHEVLEDVKDVFTFISSSQFLIDGKYSVDANRIAVGGESFGGNIARLAALYAEPKPKFMFSNYGQGGALLTPQYLIPRKSQAEMPANVPFFEPYPHPFMESILSSTKVVTGTALGRDESGKPLDPRAGAAMYLIQHANWLDAFVGKKWFSDSLRGKIAERGGSIYMLGPSDIDPEDLPLFSEFHITGDFPPSILVHGTGDTAVSHSESAKTASQLRAVGVDVLHVEVQGGEHFFDVLSKWNGEVDHPMYKTIKYAEIEAFMKKYLS